VNINDMKTLLQFYVDDVSDPNIAVQLFNEAQNKMAVAAKANFPQLATGGLETPVFPAKYHGMLVTYAAAKFKEYDSSIREAGNFMAQFMTALDDFTKTYVVPMRYKDDYDIQQFTASDGNKTFTITKDGYDPINVELTVHVNDVKTFDFTTDDNTFTVNNAVDDDAVTASWEVKATLSEPPYAWWWQMP